MKLSSPCPCVCARPVLGHPIPVPGFGIPDQAELTGLRGKIGETDSRLLKIYLLTLEEKINSLIEEKRYEEAQSLTLLLKKELNPLNEEQDDKHE